MTEFIDKTGELPSQRDFHDAIFAITNSVLRDITKLPPELGVNMLNILRCLKAGKALFAAVEKGKTPEKEK